MSMFAAAKITMLQLVRRYRYQGEDNEIRFKQFEFERAFKQIFPLSPSVTPNIEAAAPETPRFIFQQNKMNLVVTGNTCQLTLSFEDGFPQDASVIKFAKKYSEIMDSCLAKVLNDRKTYSGILLYIALPYIDGQYVDFSRFRSLVNNKSLPNISALNLEAGYEIDGIMRLISVSDYKYFERKFVNERFAHIDSDFDEPNEIGVQIRLDVNTKPMLQKDSVDSFSVLLPHFEKLVTKDSRQFLGDAMPDLK